MTTSLAFPFDANKLPNALKAIESTTSVVMQLRTDEARAVWQNHLTHATYKSAVSCLDVVDPLTDAMA